MIVKQRETAKELCDKGFIKVNGQNAKPSKHVCVGDVIDIDMMDEHRKCRIVSIPVGNIRKNEDHLYFKEVRDSEEP